MKTRRSILILLSLSALCACWIAIGHLLSERRVDRLFRRAQAETNIVNLESWIGPPYEVYDQYPPSLGKDLISEEDFAAGSCLKAYVLRRMPPKLLIVKYHKATGRIIAFKIETS